jgi:hypothetical protein
MSKVTELASGQLTSTETITVELIEADETPAVVILRWPSKPTVIHPHRFPTPADNAAGPSLLLPCGWQRSNGSVSCDQDCRANVWWQ